MIAFNAHHPLGRRRFTVAHEFVLDHLESFHIDFAARESGEGRPGYNATKEKEANAFAATLLMPEEWVPREVEKAIFGHFLHRQDIRTR